MEVNLLQKKRRSVCILLFIVLLLTSCICLEPVRTDAWMSFSTATNNSRHSFTRDTLQSDSDLCTAEMLGNHASGYLCRQTASRRQQSSRENLTFTTGACSIAVWYPFVPQFLVIRQNIYISTPYVIHLIRILHKMDGKKRLFL
jgi:hypothetical protein